MGGDFAEQIRQEIVDIGKAKESIKKKNRERKKKDRENKKKLNEEKAKCRSKRVFNNRNKANGYASRLTYSTGIKYTSYHCKHCSNYHLTSKK